MTETGMQVSSLAALGTPPMAPPGLYPVTLRPPPLTDGLPMPPTQLHHATSRQPSQGLPLEGPGSTGPSMRGASLPAAQSFRPGMQAPSWPTATAELIAAAAARGSSLSSSNGSSLGASSLGTSAFMPSIHPGMPGRWAGSGAPAASAAAEASTWQGRQASRASAARPPSSGASAAAAAAAPPGVPGPDLLRQAGTEAHQAPFHPPSSNGSSNGRQRAVRQQGDQQSAAPSGPAENGAVAQPPDRQGADGARPGAVLPAAGSTVRAGSFKMPPSPKSPTAWAEGLEPCTNLERLFLALTPVLQPRAARNPVLVGAAVPLSVSVLAGWCRCS